MGKGRGEGKGRGGGGGRLDRFWGLLRGGGWWWDWLGLRFGRYAYDLYTVVWGGDEESY